MKKISRIFGELAQFVYKKTSILCTYIYIYMNIEHDHCHYQLDCSVPWNISLLQHKSSQSRKRDYFTIINIMNIEHYILQYTYMLYHNSFMFFFFLFGHAFSIQSCCHLLYHFLLYLLLEKKMQQKSQATAVTALPKRRRMIDRVLESKRSCKKDNKLSFMALLNVRLIF